MKAATICNPRAVLFDGCVPLNNGPCRMAVKHLLAAATLASASLVTALAATDAVAQPSETVLAKGAWTKKSYAASGTWMIVDRGGMIYVVLSGDFATKSAPDLKIFLSPLRSTDITARNATEGALLVAPLASNHGPQSYALPDGTDLKNYKSIIIHCQEYSVLWAVSDL